MFEGPLIVTRASRSCEHYVSANLAVLRQPITTHHSTSQLESLILVIVKPFPMSDNSSSQSQSANPSTSFARYASSISARLADGEDAYVAWFEEVLGIFVCDWQV